MELPICTSRLILRKFRESDLNDMYEYLSDPEVVKFEPYLPMSPEECRKELEKRIAAQDMIAIELADSGKLIGNIYFSPRDFESFELGYVMNRRYWHQGFAAEACQAVIKAAFDRGSHRIFAECDPMNPASWRLLERLGFSREAHLKQNVFFHRDKQGNPIWKDTYIYSLLRKA